MAVRRLHKNFDRSLSKRHIISLGYFVPQPGFVKNNLYRL